MTCLRHCLQNTSWLLLLAVLASSEFQISPEARIARTCSASRGINAFLLPVPRNSAQMVRRSVSVGRGHPVIRPVMLARPAAATTKIIIDGNNLMVQKGVTKGRDQLAEKLSGIDAVLVYDGREGETETQSGSEPTVIVTDAEVTADDKIMDLINSIRDEAERGSTEIQLISADRELCKRAKQAGVDKTINPAKFWSRYKERLKAETVRKKNGVPKGASLNKVDAI